MGVEREYIYHCLTLEILNDVVHTESANMLIMVLAHLQASGDKSLVQEFVSASGSFCGAIADNYSMQYPLLKKWAEYLVENTMALGSGSQCVKGLLLEFLD
jgi:hypothetical protein